MKEKDRKIPIPQPSVRKAKPPPLPRKAEPEGLLELEISVELPRGSSGPPPLRIQDAALEANIIRLFETLFKKEPVLKALFGDCSMPVIDKDENLIVGGRTVGRVFTELERPYVRVFFEKLGWDGGAEQKMRMFTGSAAFVFSAARKCKFFVVDGKGFRLAYSSSENGSIAMQI